MKCFLYDALGFPLLSTSLYSFRSHLVSFRFGFSDVVSMLCVCMLVLLPQRYWCGEVVVLRRMFVKYMICVCFVFAFLPNQIPF